MKKFYLFKISGVVQGVGFRPFIYGEAKKRELKGYVKNTGEGVEILTNDKKSTLEIFEALPPLAKIESIMTEEVILEKNIPESFEIHFSKNSKSSLGAKIPTETSICEECQKELLDNQDYRYQYFFISCTNCGPRFSITQAIPFDRENTTLKDFPLCKKCNDEYSDPENRRFHAQTTACKNCGPTLTLYKNGNQISNEDPLASTIELLKNDKIVSIKGVGGFFLTCTALPQNAQKLRTLLKRPKKPFALMVKNLEEAKKLCHISEKEIELLTSKERPIVLCKKKNISEFKDIAENNRLGIMLPYTGIHHLFFQKIDQPLIITSANKPGIPIPTERINQDWEYILDYDRKIQNFVDDSVVKVIGKQPLLIRRSRGFVPQVIDIPKRFQTFEGDVLAFGSSLKNTFCIKKGNQLFISQHLGNTEKIENLENFKTTLNHFLNYTKAEPQTILCDQNLTLQTSVFAQEFSDKRNVKLLPVQHHLAHIFSTALEHNLNNFIGISADGTGWGSDEKVWGGEVFHNTKRVGHLEYQALVGGDIANKEPVRFLVGILKNFMSFDEIQNLLTSFKSTELQIFYKQAEQNFNCIESSSCGRVLDAVCILLGLGDKNHYEGYLAEILETKASKKMVQNLDFSPLIKKQNDQYILETSELFKFLVQNLSTTPKEELALFVSKYLAQGFYEISQKANPSLPVVFSGGCAYSSIMTEFLLEKGVKINQEIPAGDGGISAGQIAYFLWKNKF